MPVKCNKYTPRTHTLHIENNKHGKNLFYHKPLSTVQTQQQCSMLMSI